MNSDTPDTVFSMPASGLGKILARAVKETPNAQAQFEPFLLALDEVAAKWKTERPDDVTPRQVMMLDAMVAQTLERLG